MTMSSERGGLSGGDGGSDSVGYAYWLLLSVGVSSAKTL